MRLSSGDLGTSRGGTGGAPVRIGKGGSTPDISVDERLACVDISSSDSEPALGDNWVAAGGGGGTGRDSATGGRGGRPALGAVGTAPRS